MLAFAKEGFEVACANEKDPFAVESYRHNFRATAFITSLFKSRSDECAALIN